MPYTTPVIPETVTVHLGLPDSPAENVTVPFAEYIKNVASSEIYPTWPESALRANILAQISFTLNRIYSEHYRSRGYDFDVTSTTQLDHAFVKDREIFENISRIVDDIFNNYIVRQGNVEPLFAQFCDGVRTQCSGLSQWGSVNLAEQGYTPYEILQYYYGNDINIVFNAPVGANIPTFPGIPIGRGAIGDDVLTIKRQLNRIGKNYPAIPAIDVENDVYDRQTEEAVREFQRIFNLSQDGIVGKATWYKLKEIYNGVKKISEITSEGITISEAERRYPPAFGPGDSGVPVLLFQYYLNFIGSFIPELPAPPLTGVYDDETRAAVIAFQQFYRLPADGLVGRNTWNVIRDAYNRVLADLPEDYRQFAGEVFPGRNILLGDTGENVVLIQTNLRNISQNDPEIPPVEVTGVFDEQTAAAVRALQRQLGFPENGVVGALTWSNIITRGSGF